MVIEIRLYKRYDTDLIALHDAGYCISDLMGKAISGYANGTPVHYLISEAIDFDMNGKQSFRTRFTISNSDTKAIHMLKNIKHGYRNSFCKMVLRDALIFQNLSAYFSDASLLDLHRARIQNLVTASIPNLYICDEAKAKHRKAKRKEAILAWNDGASNSNNQPVSSRQAVTPVNNSGTSNNIVDNYVSQINSVNNTDNTMPNDATVQMEQLKMLQEQMAQLQIQLAQTQKISANDTQPLNGITSTASLSGSISKDVDEAMGIVDDDDLMAAFEKMMG